MWLSVVMLTIMWTVHKGVQFPVLLLTKILILASNLGPPTGDKSCMVGAVDFEKMKLDQPDDTQLQKPVSDGTTGYLDDGDDTKIALSMEPASGKLQQCQSTLLVINLIEK